MAAIIKIKRSSTAGSAPTLLEGEIAVNLFDRKIYVGNSVGTTAIGGEDFRLTSQSPTAEAGAYLKLLGDSVLSTNTVLLSAGEGIDIVRESNGSITFSGENASTSNKGIASFSSSNFTTSSGAISLADSASGAVLTVSGTSKEVEVTRASGTVTVGLPDNVEIAGNLDVAGATNFAGNLSIDGNLTVEGATTYLSTSTVYADDGMFKLAANNVGDTIDTGIYGAIYHSANTTYTYAGYFRDASDGGTFKFYTGLDVEPTGTVNISDSGYALAQLDAIIDGGSY